jgi:hypothetical protein
MARSWPPKLTKQYIEIMQKLGKLAAAHNPAIISQTWSRAVWLGGNSHSSEEAFHSPATLSARHFSALIPQDEARK